MFVSVINRIFSTLAVFLILTGLSGCNPDKNDIEKDPDGVISKLGHIWKSPVSEGILGYGLYHGFVINERAVLCIGTRKSTDPAVYGEFYLILKDLSTGRNLWTWNEFYGNRLSSTLNESIVFNGDKLLIHDRYADYCIDIRTGKTVWKYSRGFASYPELTLLNDNYFITGNSLNTSADGKVQNSFFEGDINNGNLKEIAKPPYNTEYAYHNGNALYIGSTLGIRGFKDQESEFIVVPYVEMGPAARFTPNRSYFGLFNNIKKSWVYDRQPVSEPEDGASASHLPIVEGQKIFLTSLATIGKYDMLSGKALWKKRLTDANTGISDFTLSGNAVAVAVQNGTVYCLHADTGILKWTLPYGTSSDLYIQNGVLYWISGDNLMAADIETGKLIWNLVPPDRNEKPSGSNFSGFVTGIPGKIGEKGRIYVTTSLNAFCFEAVK